MNAQEPERWLPVPGYEGRYSVSNRGQVRSEDRMRNARGGKLAALRGRILRPTRDRHGHLRVWLCDGRKDTGIFVHVVVLSAFVGLRPDGMHGCHNDGEPANNHLHNLRWGTPRSNQRDRIRHGTSCRGERSASAKLTEREAMAIRSDCRKHREIAEEYGIDRSTVSTIKSGRSWAHLEEAA